MTLHLPPTLLLNADYRPLEFFPLSKVGFNECMKAVFKETVTVVAEYDRVVRSPSFEMFLPSVIALKRFQPRTKQLMAFTRFNVYLRDAHICQYCCERFDADDLTFDHVIPRSKGGLTTWDNIVTACKPCNLRKANYSCDEVRMHPLTVPKQPALGQLALAMQEYSANYLHESWIDFCYWDSELLP